jgi:hypothetical protein
MKKIILSSTVAVLALNFASFGQIQITGGGTNNVIISVLQDITFKINPGAEAWGYIWGVNIPNSLSTADGYASDATLISGSGGVSLVSSANVSVFATRLATGSSGWAPNGMSLSFEFNNDFRLVGGDTFTVRQGTYERIWAGANGAPVPLNTLTNPGNTYTITKDSFFSSSEFGEPLNTSNITLVPEPSALSLLAVGLGGLAMVRSRRS